MKILFLFLSNIILNQYRINYINTIKLIFGLFTHLIEKAFDVCRRYIREKIFGVWR